MKGIGFFALIILIASASFAADSLTQGHWRDTNRDGVKDTYVQPYHRTTPNNTLQDNYSTKGNINPWTGQQGTVNPYRPQPNPVYK